MAAVGAGLIMWSGAGREGYVWSGMEERCWVVGFGGRGVLGREVGTRQLSGCVAVSLKQAPPSTAYLGELRHLATCCDTCLV